MRTNALVAMIVLSAAIGGCPANGGRDCEKVKLNMATLFTAVKLHGVEKNVDLRPYDAMLLEFRTLGTECKLPGGDLADLVVKLEKAEADKDVTPDELRPILVRIDELVASATGKPMAVVPAIDAETGVIAPPKREMAGNCPIPPLDPLDDTYPLFKEATRGMSPQQLQAVREVDAIAQTATANLIALVQAEVAYHAKTKKYLSFKNGNDATWKTLGVTFPRDVHHTFSAAEIPEGFRILAEGNLDKDPFVDRWLITYQTKQGGCPGAGGLASDALDVTFEGGAPGVIAKGKPQPKMKFP